MQGKGTLLTGPRPPATITARAPRLSEPRQGCGPPHRRSSRRELATRPSRHSTLQRTSGSRRRIRKSGWPCGGAGEGQRRPRSEASPRPAASRKLPVQSCERWAQVNTPCSHFRRHPGGQGAKKTQGTGGTGGEAGGRLRSKGWEGKVKEGLGVPGQGAPPSAPARGDPRRHEEAQRQEARA